MQRKLNFHAAKASWWWTIFAIAMLMFISQTASMHQALYNTYDPSWMSVIEEIIHTGIRLYKFIQLSHKCIFPDDDVTLTILKWIILKKYWIQLLIWIWRCQDNGDHTDVNITISNERMSTTFKVINGKTPHFSRSLSEK